MCMHTANLQKKKNNFFIRAFFSSKTYSRYPFSNFCFAKAWHFLKILWHLFFGDGGSFNSFINSFYNNLLIKGSIKQIHQNKGYTIYLKCWYLTKNHTSNLTAGVSIYVIRLDIIFLVGCMVEYLKLHARNFNFF